MKLPALTELRPLSCLASTSSLASSRYPQARRATWRGVINENLIKPGGTSPPQCPQRVKLPFTAPYITMFLSHFLTVTPCRAAPWPPTGVIVSKTAAPPALRDYFNARSEFSPYFQLAIPGSEILVQRRERQDLGALLEWGHSQ